MTGKELQTELIDILIINLKILMVLQVPIVPIQETPLQTHQPTQTRIGFPMYILLAYKNHQTETWTMTLKSKI